MYVKFTKFVNTEGKRNSEVICSYMFLQDNLRTGFEAFPMHLR